MIKKATLSPSSHMNRLSRGLALALVPLALALCLLGCRSKPEMRHYVLSLDASQDALAQGARNASSREIVIGVEPLSAEAVYDDVRMVYRKSPYRVDYYYYHRWSAPPSLMLTDALRDGITQTGAFERVTTGYGKGVDAILHGRVVALEEVDRSETEWIARVVLELELEDSMTGDIVWSGTFEQERDVVTLNPEGVTVAASEALGAIIVEIVPQMVSAMAQSSALSLSP